MSDLIPRTARLVPYTKRPKHVAGFVTAYVFEPAADDPGAKLGNLYVVVEVLVSGRASEEVVDLIIQTFGDAYYNAEGAADVDPGTRFESATRHLNHALADYVNKGNAAWIGKLSAIIAVQAKDDLHVTQTGSAEAYLYRGKAVSQITQPETGKPASPLKTFGTIASGSLDVEDRVLLATPALIHQIPLKKLQSLVGRLSPNAAIAEISQLIPSSATARIAALVIEFTTPELAALKVRSDEPSEIELAAPANIAEAAIQTAAPIVTSTAEGSKKLASVAASHVEKIKPRLKKAGLTAAEYLRQQLAAPGGRKRAGIALIIITVLIVALIAWSSIARSGAQAFKSYQDLYSRYAAASARISTDHESARRELSTVSTELAKLKSREKDINRALKNNPLLENEPNTFAAFTSLLAAKLDEAGGLYRLKPFVITEVGGSTGKPNHFEVFGGKAYVFDSKNDNALSIIDLATGNQRDSKIQGSSLGNVVATTLLSTNDGILLLTDKPSVWVYKFANDSISEQSVAFGTWPKGQAIASYGGNVYIRTQSAITKQVRSAAGYSPKTDYIPAPNGAGLAIDGYIYYTDGHALVQYLGTTKQASSDAIGNDYENLRSVADGKLIIATSSAHNRLAIWKITAGKPVFDREIAFTDPAAIADATYDAKSGKIYALAGNRLVSVEF